MKKDKKVNDADTLTEYNFSGGERGKYVGRYAQGTNIVVLSPDVAEVFPDSDSVNAALRTLMNIAKHQQKISPDR